MKAVEFKRQVRPLLPLENRWEFRGSFCYRAPVGLFAFGVLSEGSAFDEGAYIWSVSIPLFLPNDHIDLSYSDRVGGGSRKYSSSEPESLQGAIREALATKRDERDELQRLVKLGFRSTNIRLLEAASYSSALLGDHVNAAGIAGRATDVLVERDWEQEVRDRVIGFGQMIRKGETGPAGDLLNAQAASTASALRLAT